MPIHHEQIRLRFALQNHWITARRRLREVRFVTVNLDVHTHATVSRNVRSDEQLQLCLLERGLNTHRTHLGEGDQGALCNASITVIECQYAWATQDPNHAGCFGSGQAQRQVDSVVDRTKSEADCATGTRTY